MIQSLLNCVEILWILLPTCLLDKLELRHIHGNAHAVLRKVPSERLDIHSHATINLFNECCKATIVGDLPARVRDGVITSGVKVGIVFCYLAQQFISLAKVLEAVAQISPSSLREKSRSLCRRWRRGPAPPQWALSGRVNAHNIAPYQQPGLLDAKPGKEELLRPIPSLRRVDEAEGFDAVAEEVGEGEGASKGCFVLRMLYMSRLRFVACHVVAEMLLIMSTFPC
ncbi:hypothetical protein KC326_g120 [Hortaea werneckii]|nr:hypothetical protein KC326_g120 [Hortaea werneckii]